MATNENLNGMTPFTMTASTGLRQYRAVAVNTSGVAAEPTAGASIVGVIRHLTESTASGHTPTVALYTNGMIAKMEATASTVAVGDNVQVSTAGEAIALASGGYAIGTVVAGSSGAANRILSVLLAPIGTT